MQSSSTILRANQRTIEQVRPIKITRHYTAYAEGSVLVEFGQTKVLCNATIEENVPKWLKGKGKGWVTAEYAMLPRATHTRNRREAKQGGQGGRTMEIQRLIARSLRAVVDLKALGEYMITLDCDVIQADGGTRTAAISGASVALHDALSHLLAQGKLTTHPMQGQVAAVSVGLVDDQVRCDLEYIEDSQADTDMNVVMTQAGDIVEIQGTAEEEPFNQARLIEMLDSARQGIAQIVSAQQAALESVHP